MSKTKNRKNKIIDRTKIFLAGFIAIAMSLSMVQGLISFIIMISER